MLVQNKVYFSQNFVELFANGEEFFLKLSLSVIEDIDLAFIGAQVLRLDIGQAFTKALIFGKKILFVGFEVA